MRGQQDRLLVQQPVNKEGLSKGSQARAANREVTPTPLTVKGHKERWLLQEHGEAQDTQGPTKQNTVKHGDGGRRRQPTQV